MDMRMRGLLTAWLLISMWTPSLAQTTGAGAIARERISIRSRIADESLAPRSPAARGCEQAPPAALLSLPELRELAVTGDVDAQVALAGAYEAGLGVPVNLGTAASWYAKAADGGHPGAQFNLATMYHDGQGVQKSAATAARWYRAAAEQDDPVAQLALAKLLDAGATGVSRDPAQALGWYQKAATLGGLADAQYALGRMYERGRDVARNVHTAVDSYRKAADQGHTEAQIALGRLLSGRSDDLMNAIDAHMWFNLAASRWTSESQRVRAVRLRDALAASMTPGQLLEAARRAIAWQDTVGMGRR
jgi:TPR repeat protein